MLFDTVFSCFFFGGELARRWEGIDVIPFPTRVGQAELPQVGGTLT